ncbi:CU044_5270 family protein [Streptoalloteichus hindustanus]|uniref:CU044_5270 family protein n=1 Tax=Streptoalloteichus hindustanus TaxID=2017 RepID=A0A1M4W1U8_STRHI|nr:CU044_5270 family protein [Streptoalloteichus hindustanus]SHE75254.1 hypothetical protein SAMN05444320_101973 [Streptoalloteichus hindustanus]
MSEDEPRRLWSDEELDQALAALHADVPTNDAALAGARARLMAAAVAEGDHEVRALTEERTRPVEPRPSLWRRSRSVRWLSGVAAVSALVVGGLVAQTAFMGENSPGSVANAAELLNRAADAAIRTKDQEVKPGQFRYLRTTAWHSTEIPLTKKDAPSGERQSVEGLETLTYLVKGVTEYWIPANFQDEWMQRRTWNAERKYPEGVEAKLRERYGNPSPPKTEVRRAKAGVFYRGEPAFEEKPDGSLVPVNQSTESKEEGRLGDGGWADPTPEFFAKLPRDPQQLLDRIYQDSRGQGPGPDEEAFVFVRDVMRTGRVPADVRAALFRAAAKIPGMRITDDAANLDGRKGVAISRSDANDRTDLIFAPDTGEVIGERVVTTKGREGVPAGTVMSWTAISSAVVSKAGERTGS